MFNTNKKDRNIHSSGEESINNTGDGAHFGDVYNNYNPPKSLNHSLLFDFCIKFSKKKFEFDLENDKTLPSDIEEKIVYNEIDVFKDIFYDCEQYYDDVQEILNEVPNRQKIIKNINHLYKKKKKFNKWTDKDELCQLIFTDLYKVIAIKNDSDNIMEEDANLAIHSIMYYAFVKCKLLDPIPVLT